MALIPIFIWGQTNTGLRFVQQSQPYDLPGNTIYTINQDFWGALWIGTENGLVRFDGYSFKPISEKEADNPNSPSKNFIKKVFRDSKNKLWIGMHKGLSVYNDSTYNLQHLSKFENIYVNSIKEDANKNLWVGTHEGLYIIPDDISNTFHVENKNHSELSNKKINFISSDNKGNFWIVSEYGIHKISEKEVSEKSKVNISASRMEANIMNCPIKGRVGFFFIDQKNNAWLCINNTIYMLSLDDGEFNLDAAKTVIEGEEYLCACMDSNGDLWVGTRYRGITHLKKDEEGKITQNRKYWISPDHYYDIRNTVTALFEDKLGNIWVGTQNGLFTLKKSNNQNLKSIKEGRGNNSLTNNIVTSIVYTKIDQRIYGLLPRMDSIDYRGIATKPTK